MRRGFRWSWVAPGFKGTGKSGANQQNRWRDGAAESQFSYNHRFCFGNQDSASEFKGRSPCLYISM
jgi:hypothetical protein